MNSVYTSICYLCINSDKLEVWIGKNATKIDQPSISFLTSMDDKVVVCLLLNEYRCLRKTVERLSAKIIYDENSFNNAIEDKRSKRWFTISKSMAYKHSNYKSFEIRRQNQMSQKLLTLEETISQYLGQPVKDAVIEATDASDSVDYVVFTVVSTGEQKRLIHGEWNSYEGAVKAKEVHIPSGVATDMLEDDFKQEETITKEVQETVGQITANVQLKLGDKYYHTHEPFQGHEVLKEDNNAYYLAYCHGSCSKITYVSKTKTQDEFDKDWHSSSTEAYHAKIVYNQKQLDREIQFYNGLVERDKQVKTKNLINHILTNEKSF